MLAMALIEVLIIIAIFGVIASVFFSIIKTVGKRKVNLAERREVAMSSLNRKISELTQKRAELERLRKEVDVTEDLAEVDRQLNELRVQLKAVEGRQVADPAKQ